MTLLDNAKKLQRTMTDAEQKLWYYLRAYRFKRENSKVKDLLADISWSSFVWRRS